MRMVQKFGGTSLQDSERLHRAAEIVETARCSGFQVAVVVSAQGDMTDHLIAQAEKINPAPGLRELDALLATGEQQSAALLAMALQRRGVPAVSLTGWQAGIHTNGRFGCAEMERIAPGWVERALDAGAVPVIAGFQGVDGSNNITTLGRGGSDTTAVALAAAIGAELCRIYTDVDGVYDRDPRIFPDAQKFSRIGYAEMLELAQRGAQVLHPRCVELAQQENLPLEVRSAFTDAPGTMVG